MEQLRSWASGLVRIGWRPVPTPELDTAPDPRDTDPAHRNGYAPYPDTLILSTERSGLNLIRHTVESATGQRTPGKTHMLAKGPLAFHRSHWVNTQTISPGRAPLCDDTGHPLYRKLVLLLRDPFEILPRAYGSQLERMHDYCDNLLAYANFEGPKLLVIYDELVGNDQVLAEVLEFLGLGGWLQTADIPHIRATSVTWYDANQAEGGGSQTQGSPVALRVHQQKLGQEERDALRELLFTRLGALVHRYLGRWL